MVLWQNCDGIDSLGVSISKEFKPALDSIAPPTDSSTLEPIAALELIVALGPVLPPRALLSLKRTLLERKPLYVIFKMESPMIL